jgi:hypothetical protein
LGGSVVAISLFVPPAKSSDGTTPEAEGSTGTGRLTLDGIGDADTLNDVVCIEPGDSEGKREEVFTA